MEAFKGYSYYKSLPGPHSGVTIVENSLLLNGQPLRIISGTIHYFRIVPEYWHNRLQLLKASGCNCVETYVAWNAHEPLPGQFDFQGIYDIRRFIETAAELDLLVIFRPGPYICAEWEFGGLPSWLLQDEKMAVRTTYPPFIAATDRFFGALLPLVADLQFTQNGPIIAVQIENEYGAYGSDRKYMDAVGGLLKKHGVRELLFTSDGPADLAAGQASDAWMTVNEQSNLGDVLDKLEAIQPGKPLMVTEYWAGWFDHWTEPIHHTTSVEKYTSELTTILSRGASVNFYVYHGGTNFGFMNGANSGLFNSTEGYQPTITSYDYDCLISESGLLTPKWHETRKLLARFGLLPKDAPVPVENDPARSYGALKTVGWMPLRDLLEQCPRLQAETPLPMERLTYKNGYGQSYGFIAYEKTIANAGGELVIEELHDRAIVLVNGKAEAVIDFTKSMDKNHQIQIKPIKERNGPFILTILVENMGRVNFVRAPKTLDTQRKGIIGGVSLNGQPLTDWAIQPLEFNQSEVEKIFSTDALWKIHPVASDNSSAAPGLFKFHLNIEGAPQDTFLSLDGWGRGVAFVNGFNLGRYWPTAGPGKTLYVPAPVLKTGSNTIVLFELHATAGSTIDLVDAPVLGPLA